MELIAHMGSGNITTVVVDLIVTLPICASPIGVRATVPSNSGGPTKREPCVVTLTGKRNNLERFVVAPATPLD